MSVFQMFFAAYMPWFWFGLAVVFSIIEIGTLGLTTIWCAISAAIMIFISLLPVPLKWQLLLFTFISLILLFFTRPLVAERLQAKREKTNADSLIGKKAEVLETITEMKKGQVKINGLVWTAASADGSEIAKGCTCLVEQIKGVTLIVKCLQN